MDGWGDTDNTEHNRPDIHVSILVVMDGWGDTRRPVGLTSTTGECFNPCCDGWLGWYVRYGVWDSDLGDVSILVVMDGWGDTVIETACAKYGWRFNPCCDGWLGWYKTWTEQEATYRKFQSLLWWMVGVIRGRFYFRGNWTNVSILVVMDGWGDTTDSLGPLLGSLGFQSLLWWMVGVIHYPTMFCDSTQTLFQSLLWWMVGVIPGNCGWAYCRYASFNPCCDGWLGWYAVAM